MIVRAAYTDHTYAICHRHYDMDTDLRGEPRVALGPVQDARDRGCVWCARSHERALEECRVVGPRNGYYHVQGPPQRGAQHGSRCSVLVDLSHGTEPCTLVDYETIEQAGMDMAVWFDRGEAVAALERARAFARAVRS